MKLRELLSIKKEERAVAIAAALLALCLNALVISRYHQLFMEPVDNYWKLFIDNFRISGFDPITFEGFTQTLEELFPKERIRGVVSLMGPSFAKEVANHQRTAVCAVGHNQKCNEEVQHLFSNDYFRVYTQDDVIGAEIGAGMKNIIAIASGILSGLGYENNSRAALITRGLAEITRFGLAKGAKEKTFLGLTGIGDLFLTCSSPMSRNFSAGVEIGEADSGENFLKNNKTTVEGIEACRLVHQEAKRIGVSVPITDAIYAILFHRLRPSAVVSLLMNRALKAE